MAVADTETRQTVARLRHFPASPTKVRPVLKLIAGEDIASARDTLRLSDRAIAPHIAKVLDSAVANAEHNDNIPEDELFVAQARADEGPTQKRWRPRARGRGTRIRKRTTHLTIVVARFGDEQLERRRQAELAGAHGPRRPTRRRAARAVEHDHERDEELDVDDVESAAAAPAKATAEKTAKKSTAKKSTAKKSTAKKTAADKSTTKKTTAKKTTKKSATTAKKSTAKKTAKKPTKKSQDD